MAGEDAYIPPEFRPKPLWRRILNLAVFTGLIYGIYYAWQTGGLLKALDWLVSQDVITLTTIAVVALIATMLGLRGV
ncbi:MAG: hypothetical protein GOV00_02365 [Candidatus Altiarchaeota archaeon]|nr:hypothetical protein [Candidatus Altiarchaeota archaeon]